MLRNQEYCNQIHVIWLRGKVPKYMKKCMLQLIKVHPNNTINFWIDKDAYENNKDFFTQEILSKNLNTCLKDIEQEEFIQTHPVITSTRDIHKLGLAIQSDLYRLVILQKLGGVYLDTDYYFVRNIFDLLESLVDAEYLPENEKSFSIDELAIIPIEDAKKHHCNGLIFCAKPNNPFINACIDKVIPMPQALRRSLCTVGPNLIGLTQLEYRKEHKGLFSIPWQHLHSLTWYDAAYIFEDKKTYTYYIPDIYQDTNENVGYGIYAVHMWNDLIDPEMDIIFEYEKDKKQEEQEVINTTAHIESRIDEILGIKESICTSVNLKECTINCEPLPELRIGDKYIEITTQDKVTPMYISIKAITGRSIITEDTVKEDIQKVVDSVAGNVLEFGINPVRNAHAYTPIVIALCEYLYQVHNMYKKSRILDRLPILLCYRDSYLINQIMRKCSRYANLDLIPVWMNRDIAGRAAGFEGPGYQFEPDYSAYGVPNPYHTEQSDEIAKLLKQYKDSIDTNLPMRLANVLVDSPTYLVFDLSTCHFSAQDTFAKIFSGKEILGCYLFTFTRATNDSYRLREDYKAWGHITVNEANSKAMKALENMLSWPHPAMDAGIVGSLDSFVQSEEHSYIIDSAVNYLENVGNDLYRVPTIATGLSVLPDKFTI